LNGTVTVCQFKLDFVITGASAIDDDGALLDFDSQEVQVVSAIIENARHVILVPDANKFERTAPVRTGHLGRVKTIVTNARAPEAIRVICLEHDLR
jgi:DeoR family glycerol-3-phosphate regulon repressor